ncbi:MAG TPA: hypothetical protein VNL39_12845 [Xanthobacteraceae bacterium]|nr:hypothetical protein [Xanthobacteraceae bacterium]
MIILRTLAVAVLAIGLAGAALAGDDVLDAIEQARKAYRSGDLAGAKLSLDTASQLIGQKNADTFAALLPNPLPGWKTERTQTSAVGAVMLGATVASRSYSNDKGESIEVQITGDSALVTQFAVFFTNPQIAGAIGRLIRVGDQRAIQTPDGDINILVANKFLVTVQGTGAVSDKIAYAQAVDVMRLTRM